MLKTLNIIIAKTNKFGINMLNLFKLIKTAGNNDALTLYVKKGESVLGIKIKQ